MMWMQSKPGGRRGRGWWSLSSLVSVRTKGFTTTGGHAKLGKLHPQPGKEGVGIN